MYLRELVFDRAHYTRLEGTYWFYLSIGGFLIYLTSLVEHFSKIRFDLLNSVFNIIKQIISMPVLKVFSYLLLII